MSTLDVTVPDIGDFTDVPIVEILVAEGDEVESDAPLVVLESDKASMEIPAPQAGTVKELKVAVGDRVNVGQLILLLDAAAGGWRPTFRRVPFDYAALFAELERQRIAETYGVIGHLIVEEFRTARTRVGPFLRWRAVHRPNAPLTLALLDEFAALDPWEYTSPHFHVNRHLQDRIG